MNIHHVAVTVDDLEESTDFYTEILGFKVVKRFENQDINGEAVFIELNGFKIELWEFSDSKKPSDQLDDIKIQGIRHLAFEVEDLSEQMERLEEKGLEVSEPEKANTGNYFVFTEDPDGVALELMGPI